MILGVGADLCYVERIRRSVRRFGDPWIDRVFTADERQLCVVQPDPVLMFTQAFCSKEACAKALGTGIDDGIDWREIEVLRTNGVSLRLYGVAQMRLEAITPTNYEAELKISCSGDRLLAQAFVIAHAIPPSRSGVS